MTSVQTLQYVNDLSQKGIALGNWLKSEFWIKALVRRLNAELTTTMVIRSGNPEAGAIFLKLNFLDGYCQIFNRTFGKDGERVWSPATGTKPVAEVNADEYLRKQIEIDPDCWIVEIEDPDEKFSVDELAN